MLGAPKHEVYVIVSSVAARVGALAERIDLMGSALSDAIVPGVDVLYSRAMDKALLRLELWSVSPAVITAAAWAAQQTGMALLETALLSGEERRRFHEQILPHYGARAGGLPTLTDAQVALARLCGAHAHAGDAPACLEVRFRRGDGWQLARAREVTPDGIYVATSCPPRQGDIVELELHAGQRHARTRGAVVHVAAAEGADAGFGACFVVTDDAERRDLDGVLLAVRASAAAVAPPPQRRTPRYPVHWPLFGWLAGGWVTMAALDLSRCGLFVATRMPLPVDSTIDLVVPLDEAATVSVSARVARVVSEATASARGIAVGFGLELTRADPIMEQVFDAFVDRVAQRSARRLVVGAGPERAAAILSELSGVGYVASGAVDANALLERLAGPSPDLVILDGSLAGWRRAAKQVERALAAGGVRALHLDGESPLVIRRRADEVVL